MEPKKKVTENFHQNKNIHANLDFLQITIGVFLLFVTGAFVGVIGTASLEEENQNEQANLQTVFTNEVVVDCEESALHTNPIYPGLMLNYSGCDFELDTLSVSNENELEPLTDKIILEDNDGNRGVLEFAYDFEIEDRETFTCESYELTELENSNFTRISLNDYFHVYKKDVLTPGMTEFETLAGDTSEATYCANRNVDFVVDSILTSSDFTSKALQEYFGNTDQDLFAYGSFTVTLNPALPESEKLEVLSKFDEIIRSSGF